MARADLLVSLIKAGSRGNQDAFNKAAETLIAEEHAKKHAVLADRLRKSLHPPQNGKTLKNLRQQKPGAELLYSVVPERRLSDLVVPEAVEAPIRELIEEQHRKEILNTYNLTPRHRILLAGAPGNGKTSLAEAIAYELAVPLYIVRYDALVGSFLGETGARLKQLFEFVQSEYCVLFFDEFDAIGKERGDTHETGEIKRVVSTLLMQIDRLPEHVVVVTASNHPELLDRAVWRRFQLRLELPVPLLKDITKFISKRINEFRFKERFPSGKIAKAVRGSSFAEIEELLLDIQRRYVLSLPNTNLARTVENCLNQWGTRFKLNGGANNGSRSTITKIQKEKGSR